MRTKISFHEIQLLPMEEEQVTQLTPNGVRLLLQMDDPILVK